METAIQRLEFREGVESLSRAYQDATDRLVMQDPAANQRVLDLLRLWSEVLGDDFAFADTHVGPVLEGQTAVEKHQTAIEQLALSIRHCDSSDIDLWSGILMGTLRSYLARVEDLAIDRASMVRNGPTDTEESQVIATQNEQRTASLLMARLEQMEMSHRLRTATHLAVTAVREAQQAAVDARNAAGFASTSSLTEQFKTLETAEATSAKWFRIATIVTTVIAVVLSFFLGPNDDAGVGQAIFRIALLAGVLGLATYLGRQAAHHRSLSTWAGTIKVQLLTFDAYIAPVDDENLKGQMRVAFATRVFGSSPDSKDESSPTLYGPLGDLIGQFARGGAKPS